LDPYQGAQEGFGRGRKKAEAKPSGKEVTSCGSDYHETAVRSRCSFRSPDKTMES
jgi:hypothetical protein